MRRGGDSHEVEALSRAMQPALLLATRRRLDAEWLPLPDLLVAGLALEWVLLEASHRASARDFRERFDEQLGVVFDYCRLRGMYVDRWMLEQQGVTRERAQARLAGVVEATVRAPIEERRVMCPFLHGTRTTAQIAADVGRPEADVRRSVARLLRAGRAATDEWMRRWTPPATGSSTKKRRKR